jgi:EAL domain-containing protein (putative c-di-GMP-specific phosphodiesterase class I)
VLINDDNLKIFIQPIYNLNNEVSGFEALLRVVEGDSLISPVSLISEMESNNTIHILDLFVIKAVSIAMKEVIIEGDFITVNLSSITLSNFDVMDELIMCCESIINSNKSINFEITETAKGKLENIVINSKKLVAKGIGVFLDDYGSGYNAFGFLGQIDVDAVKISKELLDNFTDKRTFFMMTELVRLFKNMGAKVIIEGIENKEQVKIIKNLGFDYMQGYLLGKPLHYKEYDISKNTI